MIPFFVILSEAIAKHSLGGEDLSLLRKKASILLIFFQIFVTNGYCFACPPLLEPVDRVAFPRGKATLFFVGRTFLCDG